MPHPTPTLQLRSITTCVQITRNVNMPHPTPTLQLRSITTCVQITRNVNMPHPTPTLQLRSIQHVCKLQGTLTCPTPPEPFSCVALQHVCFLQGTLTCPTPPHPTSKITTLVGAASQPPTKKDKRTFFERFCCLRLLAGKQRRKNQLPAGKHHGSEGRASSKTTPKKCLTSRLKS